MEETHKEKVTSLLSDRVDVFLVECYWRLHCLTCKLLYKVNCESCEDKRNGENCPFCGLAMTKIGTMRFTCENEGCPIVEIRHKRSKDTVYVSDEAVYGGREKVERQLERLRQKKGGSSTWG